MGQGQGGGPCQAQIRPYLPALGRISKSVGAVGSPGRGELGQVVEKVMGWGQRVDEKGRQVARLQRTLADKQKTLDLNCAGSGSRQRFLSNE